MSSEPKLYTEALRKATGQIPVWFPGADINVGDIGLRGDDGWVGVTTLNDLGVAFENHIDNTPASRVSLGRGNSWSLSGAVGGSGTMPTPVPGIDVTAGLELKLSGEGSFSMDAYGLRSHKIRNLGAVEDEILTRDNRRDGSWEYEWCLVSEVLEAERSFIAVSSGREASALLDLGFQPRVPFLDLASVDMSAQIANSSDMAFSSIQLSPTVLTFRYRKVRDTFLGSTTFNLEGKSSVPVEVKREFVYGE